MQRLFREAEFYAFFKALEGLAGSNFLRHRSSLKTRKHVIKNVGLLVDEHDRNGGADSDIILAHP
jgi:hypothetical protein